jgi:hypothetical protein
VTTLAAASSNSVSPGTLGFLVVFGLAVCLVFLFRSMSKQLRRVNAAARRDEAAAKDGTTVAAAAQDSAAAGTSASPQAPDLRPRS